MDICCDLRQSIFFIFALFVSATLPCAAATLSVTTLDDTNDMLCNENCSLREAISVAVPGDTIIFARELRGGTIQLHQTLVIDKRLTIDGPNKRRITIKGDGSFRIFFVSITGTGRLLNLDGLIIRDGAERDGDGGGIHMDPNAQSTINVTNCLILNNSARRGGGISISFGSLVLADSTVANNDATGEGGGAGIDALLPTAVRIFNSTISGNRSLSLVDGVGGIRLAGSSTSHVSGSTISYNSSNGASSASTGGLAALNGIPGVIFNTIIAKNVGLRPDFYGRVSVARNILVGIADSTTGFENGVNGNIVGSEKTPVDPSLGPLSDNGGNILSHLLSQSSPAINSGNNVLSIDSHGDLATKDQRGFARIFNSVVDMGSVEYGAAAVSRSSMIIGRVTNSADRGAFGVRVILRKPDGTFLYTQTNPTGYFRFLDLPPDVWYEIKCQSKRGSSPSQNVLVEEATEQVDFRLDQ